MTKLFLLLLAALLVWPMEAQADPALDGAKQLFQKYIDLGARFDPAAADLYSDRANIQNIRHRANGTTRTISMPAVVYKTLIRSSMAAAKERGDTDTYSDITYTREGNQVRITATRFSNPKKYSSPLSLLVATTGKGEWQIVEELSHSRP